MAQFVKLETPSHSFQMFINALLHVRHWQKFWIHWWIRESRLFIYICDECCKGEILLSGEHVRGYWFNVRVEGRLPWGNNFSHTCLSTTTITVCPITLFYFFMEIIIAPNSYLSIYLSNICHLSVYLSIYHLSVILSLQLSPTLIWVKTPEEQEPLCQKTLNGKERREVKEPKEGQWGGS